MFRSGPVTFQLVSRRAGAVTGWSQAPAPGCWGSCALDLVRGDRRGRARSPRQRGEAAVDLLRQWNEGVSSATAGADHELDDERGFALPLHHFITALKTCSTTLAWKAVTNHQTTSATLAQRGWRCRQAALWLLVAENVGQALGAQDRLDDVAPAGKEVES